MQDVGQKHPRCTLELAPFRGFGGENEREKDLQETIKDCFASLAMTIVFAGFTINVKR
jgi:hypothetical protein